MDITDLITIDPYVLSAQPVFKGSQVPIETLFDHSEQEVSLDNFLPDFPTVNKEQAIAGLENATRLLLEIR